MHNLDNWDEPSVVSFLLSLANDMRLAKGHKTIDDLPDSTPRNASSCIIANAFNYGCSVEPDSATITFETDVDRDTYLKVMGMSWTEIVDDGTDEYAMEGIIVEDYGEYFHTDAPMTNELVHIAEQFDNGLLLEKYVTFKD